MFGTLDPDSDPHPDQKCFKQTTFHGWLNFLNGMHGSMKQNMKKRQNESNIIILLPNEIDDYLNGFKVNEIGKKPHIMDKPHQTKIDCS